ncbi:dihydropteroate synthase [Hasllibacter sp. MH4015]|uniref:dihydropteroate synthase n=1 Tax=Hasllibacter sp. MH4015 TaxID=2854029 RepID=UPI001CD4C7AA|nr:dihydropteroate synthase [Hasllibacter sp. MH4015]
MTIYYRPIPQIDPVRPDGACPLAGGTAWFTHAERITRDGNAKIVPAADVPDDWCTALTAPRAPICGMSMDRMRLMGILNVTPDSFSDGGVHADVDEAVARADAMRAAGADLIDIGGESTRPGAEDVAVEEEIARIVPVIAALMARSAPPIISLDTRKSAVARAGLEAGAAIINDVSGLRFDPDLAALAADRGAPLVLMHSIATPQTMQAQADTAYGDVLLDVFDGLARAVAKATDAGVSRDRIVVDPGIGFGKTQAQNLALIQRLSLFHGLGCPVLLGVSRKGFIGQISGEARADRRGPGSAGVGLWAAGQGIQILRVHDIEMHKQALDLWTASRNGAAPT